MALSLWFGDPSDTADVGDARARRETEHGRTNDAALLARLRQGDAGALDALLRIYGAPLIRHATHVIGSADRAQDVVQDVFWSLWQERATLDVTRDIGAYLFWLTRHRALDAARRDHAVTQREGRWAAEAVAATTDNTGEGTIEAAEVRAEVWEALAEVPPRCREIFMLVWDRQLPYADVARTLGIGLPTVKNQMSRALQRLAKVFGPRFGL